MAKKIDVNKLDGAVKLAKNIAEVAEPAMEVIKPVALKYAPKVADGAKKGIKDLNGAMGKAKNAVKDKANEANEKRAQKKNAKSDEKASGENAKNVLAASAYSYKATEFMEIYTSMDELNSGNGFLNLPGCFAILTMPNSRTKDTSKFKDIYVGCSDCVGKEILKHLSGEGNIDVYADMKAKKPMQIEIFSCSHDEILGLRETLVEKLHADKSYNKREI